MVFKYFDLTNSALNGLAISGAVRHSYIATAR